MKVTVMTDHQSEGIFPTFAKGVPVEHLSPCAKYPNWHQCQILGHNTYVPSHFVNNHHLATDYNPTELTVVKGDIVEVLEIHYAWAIVRHNDEVGWLPCEILASIVTS